MKIAILADPFIPIPPVNYGGIERIIDFLIKGLIKNGHEVLLVGHKDSNVLCESWEFANEGKSWFDKLKNESLIYQVKNWRPDVIHSFGRLAYLTRLLPLRIPKIMSYQREPTLRPIKTAMRLAQKNSLIFTGCSDYITNQIKPYAQAFTVYNGVPDGIYEPNFEYRENNPLVFLGRLESIKGPHVAIKVAHATGNNLIIAGNVPNDQASKAFFHDKIAPHVDGKQIQYIGPVDDVQKNKLLRCAKAFLMPILWNEPFGIVMAEAMACGTPVVGFRRGSVPEVVETNITGYNVDTTEEMIASLRLIERIDRKKVFEAYQQRFSADIIVDSYVNLYNYSIAQIGGF